MLSFSNAVGNLFPRLGKLGVMPSVIRTSQLSMLTAMTDPVNGVVAQYDSEADLQAVMGGAYLSILNGLEGAGSTAQNLASQTINRMIFRDSPQLGQTLQSANINASILEVIRQMGLANASVLAMTVIATPAAFVGLGNGVINGSTIRPFDGRTMENAYAESLLFTCSNDSYNGGATAGNEPFQVTGVGNQGDVFAFNWPLGSNCTFSVSAIDGDVNNGSGNLLTNSGFGSWASNTPSNFTITAGAANIFRETTLVYGTSGSSMQVVGDGAATNAQFIQTFGSAGGTTATLSPQSQYSFNLFSRRDGVVPGAGTLTVDLIDGGSNVIQDAGGVYNTFTIPLTGLTTNYLSYKGVFRTPVIMPSSYALRWTFNNLTNARSVYLDKMSLGRMTQAYVSGPFGAVHAGSVPFLKGDYGNLVISNSRGAAGTLNTWQTLWARFFPSMISNEYLLPSAAIPTVSDSLIG